MERSSDLECCETYPGKENSQNPKADDNLGFCPAFFLEVMVYRSHKEDSSTLTKFFTSVLKVTCLNHH